jgi:hypothetical protein
MNSYEKRALAAQAKIVHSRGICEMCGRPATYDNPLEEHHIDGRKNYATKFMPELAMLLHSHCHRYDPEKAPHKNPQGFENWLQENRPETYELWQSLRHKIVYWFEIDLKEICRDLERREAAAERLSRVA